MNISQLLQQVEELVYQVLLLVVSIPKTLTRVVSDASWARTYVVSELSKPDADRFDEYTPPILLWTVVAIIPYLMLLDLLANVAESRVAQETGWRVFSAAPWEQRFIVVATVALALPLAFALSALRGLGQSASRARLRGPFFTQCYLLSPTFVLLLPVFGITLRFDSQIPDAFAMMNHLSWVLAVLWLFYAETTLFRAELNLSRFASWRRVAGALLLALVIFFGLEILVITAFQGLVFWR
jgi:hypothetical protein